MINKRAVAGRWRAEALCLRKEREWLRDQVSHLRIALFRAEETRQVKLPEAFLRKVIDNYVHELAKYFANKAIDQGATIHPTILMRAAEDIMHSGMRLHTLSTTEAPLTCTIRFGLEDGSIRFEFDSNGPVSLREGVNAETVKSYARYVAKSPDERLFRLSDFPNAVLDQFTPMEHVLKPIRLFESA